MGEYVKGNEYKIVTVGLVFKTPESGKEVRLNIGDKLTYVGRRRVDSSMPLSDCWRLRGNLGFIHPNNRGSVSSDVFSPEPRKNDIGLRPISDILEEINNEKRDTSEDS